MRSSIRGAHGRLWWRPASRAPREAHEIASRSHREPGHLAFTASFRARIVGGIEEMPATDHAARGPQHGGQTVGLTRAATMRQRNILAWHTRPGIHG